MIFFRKFSRLGLQVKRVRHKSSQVVYQGNSLIEGAYNITLDEIRFLYLAMTKVDSTKPQPDGVYTLFPHEFEQYFGINPKNTHTQLKEAASSLGKKPIFTYEFNEKNKRVEKIERFWFSSIRYDASGGNSDVTIRFSQDVAEYLYELKLQFTRLNFEIISKLDTPFAFRLYSWLISYKGLDRCKKASGVVVTDPITIDWMRERAGLVSKTYDEYRFFRRDVLEPALKQINAKTDISVNWEPKKIGRKVSSIVFTYLTERNTKTPVKPLRAKFPRRPKVDAGSEIERNWALRCIELMENYRQELIAYDKYLKLSVADLKKLCSWYVIVNDVRSVESLLNEIESRTKKHNVPKGI